MDFVIDPEIESLLPKHAADEFEQLRQNIVASERIDPLAVLVIGGKERVLGDGYTRKFIGDAEGIPYTTFDVEVPDRAAAIQWVIDNQLGRRNLTEERRAYYRGKEYLAKKKTEGNPQLGQNVQVGNPAGETADLLAEKHGVSGRTIRRDAQYAEGVDCIGADEGIEAKEQILSGRSGRSKRDVIAAAPILCPRCQRVGTVEKCSTCAEAQQQKPEGSSQPRAPRSRPANPRMVNVDWDEIRDGMKRALGYLETIKSAFEGEGESDEYREAKRLLEAANALICTWKRRLNRMP